MADYGVTILGAVQNPNGLGCGHLAAADPALSRAGRQGGPRRILQDLLLFYFKAVTPPVRSTQNTDLHVENSATATYK